MLRGGDAVVFPLASRYLILTYFDIEQEIEIQLQGQNSSELHTIIWSVFARALGKLNIERSQIKGLIQMNSHIMFGAGMGASATLCVALTEFFASLGYLGDDQKYSFATDLENLFHGESSGVDVAVTLFHKPLLFSRLNGFKNLEMQSHPKLYLSHTGVLGVTKDCVDQVKKMFLENRSAASEIDEQMKKTVHQFQELLKAPQVDLNSWSKTMTAAHDCFEKWGLVNHAVEAHAGQLREAGALAVKLTGSGGGGFMLSLWNQSPPRNMPFEMISCFQGSFGEN